ncbi:MAG: GNAT family N-acetyltransferase [Verrucomicrobia bacterium]|nr:GNAT family N-acetyltransferase [Verrucomicrobiota bacterium]
MEPSVTLCENILEQYPKEIELKSGFRCELLPLRHRDEKAFRALLEAVPDHERMFIKCPIRNPEVVHSWCRHIDYGHILPLLAHADRRVIGQAALHQQLGGWKRHIGRVCVLVHPKYRGRGLARAMVLEIVEIARQLGLEKLEAEFIAEQEHAMRVFGMIGFMPLVQLPDYVKDMQAVSHDYIVMGLDLVTDEEYAGVG